MAGQWLRGWAVGTPTPSGLSLPRALTIEGSASIWGAVGQSGGRDIDGNRYFIYMGRKCWDVCAERRFCFCVVYKAVKYHYQAGGEEGAFFFYPLATGSLCRLHNPLYALVHYPTGAAALQRGAAKRVERRPGSGRADCLWLGAPSRLCRVYTAALWAPEQSHGRVCPAAQRRGASSKAPPNLPIPPAPLTLRTRQPPHTRPPHMPVAPRLEALSKRRPHARPHPQTPPPSPAPSSQSQSASAQSMAAPIETQ